jgi:hypothetical protein
MYGINGYELMKEIWKLVDAIQKGRPKKQPADPAAPFATFKRQESPENATNTGESRQPRRALDTIPQK